jgi:3',5'-cyclic AMP phosphodiesterase CpdA
MEACLGPVRFAARCGPLRLVGCDTRVAGRDDGRLDAEQLAWLDARLAEEPGVPTIVALHHPPIATGVRAADAIGLPPADRAGLAEVLARHPQVRLVAAGHVHRTTLGTLAERPVLIAPSIERPALLDLDPGSVRGLVLVDEPPAYVLHALAGGELRSHVQPVAP